MISHLVRSRADFQILAVTRDASSAPAQRLVKMSPRITLVQGNLADPARLFKTAKDLARAPIWGVFSVQVSTYPTSPWLHVPLEAARLTSLSHRRPPTERTRATAASWARARP